MLQLLNRHIFHPIADLLFPKYCIACDCNITSTEQYLCFECKSTLPYTQMEQKEESDADIRMLTKLPIEHAYSLLYFVEEGMVRDMLHEFKYKNRPEIGYFLGQLLGEKLKGLPWTSTIEGIVPVPLHPKKEHARGYNQSQLIAQGLSEKLSIPLFDTLVERHKFTESQTQKNRKERIENITDAFSVKHAQQIANKHLLLIDDVLTTGATLSACGQAILNKTKCKLSIATIAIAQS